MCVSSSLLPSVFLAIVFGWAGGDTRSARNSVSPRRPERPPRSTPRPPHGSPRRLHDANKKTAGRPQGGPANCPRGFRYGQKASQRAPEAPQNGPASGDEVVRWIDSSWAPTPGHRGASPKAGGGGDSAQASSIDVLVAVPAPQADGVPLLVFPGPGVLRKSKDPVRVRDDNLGRSWPLQRWHPLCGAACSLRAVPHVLEVLEGGLLRLGARGAQDIFASIRTESEAIACRTRRGPGPPPRPLAR